MQRTPGLIAAGPGGDLNRLRRPAQGSQPGRPRCYTFAVSTVEIEVSELVELLVAANVTDPAQWPAVAREGAVMLARIREIERQCIAAQGEFDWEMLDENTQDEYDGLAIRLGKLRDSLDPDARNLNAHELRARLGLAPLDQ